jgi:secretion/DNA translocation related TadE-like protein
VKNVVTGTVTADQRGSATLPALAFLGVLLLVGSALGVVAAMVCDHRLAQSAADLAALAAAAELADGGEPCAAGARIATANEAQLERCTVEGDDVNVEVAVAGPHWLGQRHDLLAEARAGPGS